MTGPTPPTVEEGMREDFAKWLKDEFALSGWKATRMALVILSSGPIASALAARERERDEARARAKAANRRADKADKERKYFKLTRRAEHEARVAAEAKLATLRASAERMEAELKVAREFATGLVQGEL